MVQRFVTAKTSERKTQLLELGALKVVVMSRLLVDSIRWTLMFLSLFLSLSALHYRVLTFRIVLPVVLLPILNVSCARASFLAESAKEDTWRQK